MPSTAELQLTLTAEQDRTLRLSSGCVMTYGMLGDLSSPDLVIVLDGPGSRGLARAAAAAAEQVGVRLVAPDRPGFGGSTPQPGRRFGDVAIDLLELADDLGVTRFGVLAQSGGTPYALALASLAPDRIPHLAFTGALSPLGEPDALEDVAGPMRGAFVLARRAPWLLRPAFAFAARGVRRDPAGAAGKFVADAPRLDRKVLEDPRLMEVHVVSGHQAIAAPAVFAYEARLLAQPWNVDLAAITSHVALWVGEHDSTHPPVMSRRLSERLGGAPVHVVPGAGTFGVVPVLADVLTFAAGREQPVAGVA
jgi:pimeloyl-ACP methyl ester carboxylesterase